MFEQVPKKNRPNCEKVDKFGVCPKGVPRLFEENYDAYLVYTILLTQSVDGFNGILKFDPVLLGSLYDLLEVGGSGAVKLSGKLLAALDVANAKRLAKGKESEADSSFRKKGQKAISEA